MDASDQRMGIMMYAPVHGAAGQPDVAGTRSASLDHDLDPVHHVVAAGQHLHLPDPVPADQDARTLTPRARE